MSRTAVQNVCTAPLRSADEISNMRSRDATNSLDRLAVTLDLQQAHCELIVDETRRLHVCVHESKRCVFLTTAREFARSARIRATKYRVVEGTHVAG
jgi:hypothetical protein